MPVIGCDIPVVVSGTEPLGTQTGVWTKTHFRQEGNYLVATTYLVAAGAPVVFEMRVDLRPLEAVVTKVHAAMHAKMGKDPTIGFSFKKAWKSIKKTAKKIGKTKLVKAVSGAVNSVVKNKVFQIAMPMTAISAHTTSKMLGGPGVFKGALGRAVDLGTSITASIIPGGTAIKAAPQALAAFATAKSAINAINTGKDLVKTVNQAKSILTAGNRATGKLVAKVASRLPASALASRQLPSSVTAASRALATARAKAALAKTSAATKAKIITTVPAIKKAAEVKARLSQPAVKAQLTRLKTRADVAKNVVQQVAYDAKYATGAAKVDAQQSAKILNLVAQNDAKIAAIATKNAGGLPGILIDRDGRVTRGRFQVRAAAGGSLLYTAPGKVVRGSFARVAGYGGDTSVIGTSRISNDIIGTCFQVQNQKPGARNLRISGTTIAGPGNPTFMIGCAPGQIGCDCGSEF